MDFSSSKSKAAGNRGPGIAAIPSLHITTCTLDLGELQTKCLVLGWMGISEMGLSLDGPLGKCACISPVLLLLRV